MKTNQFAGKSLKDLSALQNAITLQLNRFIEAGNLEQTITYARLQAEITVQIQSEITAQVTTLRNAVNAEMEACSK